jgi:integrase
MYGCDAFILTLHSFTGNSGWLSERPSLESPAWDFAATGLPGRIMLSSAIGKTDSLTEKGMHRVDAYRMIQRRAVDAGLTGRMGCHRFRATGITAYLSNGGTLENAQAMAAHESPRTTKVYDRTGDEITLDEVERIAI